MDNMVTTTGLLLLCMTGVKLALLTGEQWPGQRFEYDTEARVLYLAGGLNLQEASHICDGVLDVVIDRALTSPVLGLGPHE
jgi:hypothetical protein